MTLQGFYSGLNYDDLAQTQTWLGGNAEILATHTGRANWSDWVSSVQWQVNRTATTESELRWSIPMFANQGNLTDAAAHAYDGYYVQAAKTLAAAAAAKGDDKIIVRVGEEFNANWMPWAAAGKEAEFIQTYRNFVDAFRSVSDKFVFEWNVNVGGTMDPAKAYPGDDYVDIIGMDFYWDTKFGITDPVQAFNYYKNTKYGLQWLEDFADAHGKQTAYSEWGVNAPNAAKYIELVHQWFDSHDPAYEIYWNYGDFKISDDGTKTAAEFQKLFNYLEQKGLNGMPVIGTAAADVLTGTNAGDLINGGQGDDKLTGGFGNDSFVFDLKSGKDVITDFGASGDKDTIDISAYLKAGYKPTVAQSGRDTVITLDSANKITLNNVNAASLTATSTGYALNSLDVLNQAGFEQKTNAAKQWDHVWDKLETSGDIDWYKVTLTKGYDMRIAVEAGGSGMGSLEDAVVSVYDAKGNLIVTDDNSGSGADALARFSVKETADYYIVVSSANGGTGSYMIDISTGNMVFSDTGGVMVGTKANETLVSSKFDDIMTGGAGNDRFQMGIGGGHDTITDFSKGDVLDIMAFKQAGASPTVTAVGHDTLLTFTTGETIKLLGTAPSEIVANYWGYYHI